MRQGDDGYTEFTREDLKRWLKAEADGTIGVLQLKRLQGWRECERGPLHSRPRTLLVMEYRGKEKGYASVWFE